MVGGNDWHVHSLLHGGDPLNGLILMGLGLVVAVALLIYNYRQTNSWYCIIGTTLLNLQFTL